MQVSTALFQSTVAGASQTVAHSVSLLLPLTRTNMCPNPSFEVSTANWSASGASAAQSAVRAVSGTKSMLVTWNNGLAAGAGTVGFTATTQPGQVYTISAQAWAVSATPSVAFAVLGVGQGTPSSTVGAWNQISYTFTATSASSAVRLINASSVAVSGTQTYLDAVLLEQAVQPGTFFDGSFTDAVWNGTAGLSTSVLNTAFAAPTVRTNLCTNPSFEAGLTNWSVAGANPPVATQSTVRAWPGAGTKSLNLAWLATSTVFDWAQTTFTATVGATYTVSCYAYVPTSSVAVIINVAGITSGFNFTTVNDQWQRISVTVVATSTTHTVTISPRSNLGGAGQIAYCDAVLIEQAPAVGGYFDGDATNATWTGAAEVSTSQLALTAYSDVGLTVESITVDRQTTTDMPDGTRLVTGYPAASAQIVLSGYIDQNDASKTIAWLLNPAQTDSPMFRKDTLNSPVSIQTGLYLPGSTIPETYTIFTGLVDDYTVDMQAGTVTLTCLDLRGLFQLVPQLPVGAFASAPPGSGLQSQLLTPGWVLNFLCESIGRYTAPPLRAQGLLRQTNHGGAWPETAPAATPTVASIFGASWTGGVFATQVPTNAYTQLDDSNSTGALKNIGSSGNPWFMECWIQSPVSSPNVVGPNYAIQLTLSGTNTTVTMGATAATLGGALIPYVNVLIGGTSTGILPASLAIPADGQWHYFAVSFHFTSTTGVSVVFYVDGQTQSATGTAGAAVPASDIVTQLIVAHLAPAESIQVTNESGTPAANNTFTANSQVVIDPSLNQLTAVPDIVGQDAWQAMQAIAESEGAVVGFDERGVFQFINRVSLRNKPPSRVISPTYSLKTLQQEVGNSTARNHIQIPINSLQVQTAQTVWSLSDTVQVDRGSTWTTNASTSNPIVSLPLTTNIIPFGGPVALSGYRASRNKDGSGGAVTNLVMTVSQINSTTVTISIRNPNVFPVWLVSPKGAGYPSTSDGQPSVLLFARPVTSTAAVLDTTTSTSAANVVDVQFPAAADGGASLSPLGNRLLGVPANSWTQSFDFAETFANDLLGDLYRPRPLWRNVTIVPDPTIQLTDRLTAADPVTTQVADDAVVFGVHFTASASSWEQTLDLRAVSTPGGWLLGVVGRSELGVATYV